MKTITLCAVSSANIKNTMRAIDICRSKMDFVDTVFITSADVKADYRVEKCPIFKDGKEGANWAFHNISFLFKTTHVLFVQWDGYIVDPAAWTDDFLEYDYIGAKWPWYPHTRVGNGGFCLRSTHLIKALEKFPVPDEKPEDAYIARMLRPALEADGMRFATEEVADRFSFERSLPTKSFGFHGMFNFPHIMPDDEFVSLLPDLDDYVANGMTFDETAGVYATMGKLDIIEKMIERRNGEGYIQKQRQNL